MIKELTREETLDRIRTFHKLVDDDDWDSAISFLQDSFPLPAKVAKAAFAAGGKDFVLSLGFDLSEAEAAYGSDWLDR